MERLETKKLFTVQELADICGISAQTVRYYHKENILVPVHREDNGYRKYDYNQIYALAKICYLRKLDFTIKEVQEYVKCMEHQENLQLLRDHTQKLRAECNAFLEMIDQITEKTEFVSRELARVTLDAPEIVEVGPRYHLPLGSEILVARNPLFFLYQTLVRYFPIPGSDQYSIAFSCHIPAEDAPHMDAPVELLPGGRFIRCYHKGAYDTVGAKITKLRQEFSQYHLAEESITLNIVDQFVENSPDNYVVVIELPII